MQLLFPFSAKHLSKMVITINGDGLTSRDFTFVDNAVYLNELALLTDNREALNQVYNGAWVDKLA